MWIYNFGSLMLLDILVSAFSSLVYTLLIIKAELLDYRVAVSLFSYTCSTSIFVSRAGVPNPPAGMFHELLSLVSP